MRLATVRTALGATNAVRIDEGRMLDTGYPDVGSLLSDKGWRVVAQSATAEVEALAVKPFAPLVTRPSKIVCVGLNYRNHILEMGRDLPEYPTLFSKFAESLVGAEDDISMPAETDEFDWECELAIVIGSPVRRATEAEAEDAIAGFTVLNDITCRDWQFRTREWLQGKSWESTTPIGPLLVTPDELSGGVRPDLAISTSIDDELMQSNRTGDLLFDPVDLVRYISILTTLHPGDIIATGTPGGVGHARQPARYLSAGEIVVTEIDGIGTCRNLVVADPGR